MRTRSTVLLTLWLAVAIPVMSEGSAGPTAKPFLSGDTNRPEMSLFHLSEEVELMFNAGGLDPADMSLKLLVSIVDARGVKLEEKELPVDPDSKGVWSARLKGPSSKLGFYRVWAKLSNGVTIPAINSKPEGFISYGVTFDPASRPAYPQEKTFFGMQGRFGKGIDAQAYLGVRWVLGPTQWRTAEPDHPEQYAEKFELALSKGEKFPPDPQSDVTFVKDGKKERWTTFFQCMCVGANDYQPIGWKVPACVAVRGKSDLTPGRWGVLTTEGEKGFESYCRTLAKAVALSYSDMTEHYYEVVWEPNIFFDGRPEDIVRYFEIAHSAIHAEDPKAVVMGPTLSSLSPTAHCCGGLNSLEYTRKLLDKGLGRFIDAYSIHPYTSVPPERHKLAECYRALRKMLYDACGRRIPIVGTEQGFKSTGDLATELVNAQCVVRANLIAMGEGLRYNLSFYTVMSGIEGKAPGGGSFGFFHSLDPPMPYEKRVTPVKVCPKPQALAYAAMTYLLEGRRSVCPVEWFGETARGYSYENEADVVLALWDFGEKPRQVEIPVGVESVELYDWMGNRSVLAAVNGIIELELGNDPVYVKGVSRKLWSSDCPKPLKIPSELSLFPGDKSELVCEVSANHGKPLRGRLVASSASKTIRISASEVDTFLVSQGASKSLRVGVEIPQEASAGDYPVSFRLIEDGVMEGIAGCVLKVLEPVKAGRLKPFVNSEGRQLVRFSLSELSGRQAKGVAMLEVQGVNDGIRRMEFALPPNGERELEASLCGLRLDPGSRYAVKLRIALDSGYVFELEEKTNFLSAKRFSKTPFVDCDTSKWNEIPFVELRGVDRCARRPDLYSGDSAKIRFAWDDKALYMLAEVKDDAFIQEQANGKLWMDDCVQCGFLLDPWKVGASSTNDLAEEANKPRRSEVVLGLTKNGPVAWRSLQFPRDAKHKVGPLTAGDCKLAVSRDDGFTVYEMAFTWVSIGFSDPPKSGDHIGVTVAVNDRDSRNQPEPSALSLFDGATDKKAPELMGLLFLSP